MNRLFTSLLAGAALGAVLCAAPAALADTANDESNTCASASGDLGIGACTWVIQSGQWASSQLDWAFNNRGFYYYKESQYDRAIEDENQAISLHPGYVAALLTRAGAYYMKGQYATAIQDYDTVIGQDSSNAQAFYFRGMSKSKLGDAGGGNVDMARGRELDPNIGK